jgi:hypothetical protein
MVVTQMQRGCWFVLAMVCFLGLTCPAFMILAPWTTAITVAEATQEYPGKVDPNWRAAAVYHGRPHEWGLGTISENPVGFAVCAVVLAFGVGGFIYCAYRSHRLLRDGPPRTNG